MRYISLALAALFVSPTVANAGKYVIDASHSSVTFKVRHMMVANVRGEFAALEGSAKVDRENPKNLQFEATIDVASINTRDAKRDGHLRSADFFAVEKYPKMTFKSKRSKKVGKNKYKVWGDLTMRGVTKEVALDVESDMREVTDPWGNTKMGATATTTINRQDFGVSWNKTLDKGGLLVGDDVQITIDVELNKQTANKS